MEKGVFKLSTFIVRLLPSVDEGLRALQRYHGDLSVIVEEAIAAAPMDKMPLVKLGGRPRQSGTETPKVLPATSFSLSKETRDVINRVASARGKSKNAVVNSALLWWLKHSSHEMRRHYPPSGVIETEAVAVSRAPASKEIADTNDWTERVRDDLIEQVRDDFREFLKEKTESISMLLSVRIPEIKVALALGYSPQIVCNLLARRGLKFTPVELGSLLALGRRKRLHLVT